MARAVASAVTSEARIKPHGSVSRRDNPLRTGARPLDDRLAVEIDAGNLERRVAEIKAVRCSTPDLTHTDLADSGFA